MNPKYLTPTIVLATLLSVITVVPVNAISVAFLAGASAASGGAASAQSSSYSVGSTNRDTLRSFQLGNYSYELARVSQYDLKYECYGHQARHGESIMDDIEKVCGVVAELVYPAQKPAGMLLREGNYFDCGRDQLRVDVIDKGDAGQQCAILLINANRREWVNGAQASRIRGLALLRPITALAAFAMLLQTV